MGASPSGGRQRLGYGAAARTRLPTNPSWPSRKASHGLTAAQGVPGRRATAADTTRVEQATLLADKDGMRRLTSCLACILLAGISLPASAGAVIVPQKGIAGVRLGMKEREVRNLLGEPRVTRTVLSEGGVCCDYISSYPAGLTVYFVGYDDGTLKLSDSSVQSVGTRGRAERTATGVGVGSALRTVRRKVPRTRCRRTYCEKPLWDKQERCHDPVRRTSRAGNKNLYWPG